MPLHAVVLAGGAGSRFWPASRRRVPKPFVSLIGRRTLLDETLQRLRGIAPPRRTWVVSARELGRITRAALRARRSVRLLLEPAARDTTAAIGWAAAHIVAHDPDALIGVFPADHHIPNAGAFARTIRSAARIAARRDALVLIGIEPSRPDGAYGYIQVARGGRGPGHPVRRFIEKPAPAQARRMLRSGDCLWNAGMVVARARLVLDECRRHAPEVWRALGPVLLQIAEGRRVSRRALEHGYRRVRPISFDHAVLERASEVLVVKGRFAWSDLGSWDALGEHLPVCDGNHVAGAPPVVNLDSSDNIVWNPTGRAVALVGVEGYVVVNTDDALLVCAKDRAQDVRRVVEALGRSRRDLA